MAVAFAPDSTTVASGGEDKCIKRVTHAGMEIETRRDQQTVAQDRHIYQARVGRLIPQIGGDLPGQGVIVALGCGVMKQFFSSTWKVKLLVRTSVAPSFIEPARLLTATSDRLIRSPNSTVRCSGDELAVAAGTTEPMLTQKLTAKTWASRPTFHGLFIARLSHKRLHERWLQTRRIFNCLPTGCVVQLIYC